MPQLFHSEVIYIYSMSSYLKTYVCVVVVCVDRLFRTWHLKCVI